MKSVLSRSLCKPSLFLGVALGSFLLCGPQANAGPAELKAIATAIFGSALPKGVDPAAVIRSASSSQLRDAVMVLLKGKTGAQAALLVGEALKRSDDSDFGTVMGAALQAQRAAADYAKIFNSNADPVKNAAAVAKFVGGSAKNAATGTAPNAEWVDEFANQLTANNQEAYDAAKAAIASKTAAGAIIGGRVLDPAIDTDPERTDLLRLAILPKSTTTGGQGLTAAAQEITRYVTASMTADQVPTIIRDLIAYPVTVGTKTTQPLLAQITTIAPGAVAGQPLEANELLDKLFTNGTGLSLDLKGKVVGDPVALATVKNAAKLAASIGLAADSEEHSFIATEFGSKIAAGFIKTTQVATIAKALTQSLTKKPVSSGSQLLGAGSNTVANRADEAAEIAAYMLNSISGLAIFKDGTGLNADKITAANKKAASAMVLGLIKAVAGGYNVNKSLNFQSAFVAADVAGSVFQTLLSLKTAGTIDADIFQSIHDTVATLKNATAISKTVAQAVLDAMNEAFNNVGGTVTKYEDGTHPEWQVGNPPTGVPDPTNKGRGNVTEPETDIRGA